MGCLLVLILAGLSAGMVALFGYAPWVMIVLGVLWLAAVVFCATAGHHGFGGGGNTDLQFAIAGAFIAWAILIPNFAAHRPCNLARAALRQVADAEARYFAEHKAYTAELPLLRLKPGPDLQVAVVKVDEQSFVATASHRLCTQGKGGAPRLFTWDSAKGGPQE